MEQRKFSLAQAEEVAEAFGREGVDYLFIGNSGAIILGFPATTQDVDLYVRKSRDNGERVIRALEGMEYKIDAELADAIRSGKDFIQIKSGPFDIDLIFAPDGIESYDAAKSRSVRQDVYPVASIDDIIASKRAAGREKDRASLPLLEDFRLAYLRSRKKPLRSAIDVTNRSDR